MLTGRSAPPSHYSFKVEAFSLLRAQVTKYTSDAFDAGGFKWNLCLYPNGDKLNGGEGYISIYLESTETSSLSTGWEINTIFNIFAFNQLKDEYVTIIQDDERVIRRYHAMKTKWGFSKFIDLETFRNPQNGYLIDDTCVFGAEVFIIQNTLKGECLSMSQEPVIYQHTWIIDNFSTLLDQLYTSASFGGYRWTILLFPNGEGAAKGSSISIYLCFDQSTIPSKTKLLVKFFLRVKDQKKGKHIERECDVVFSISTVSEWGFPKFMPLPTLKDPKLGYLVDDTCIVEAEVKLLGLVTES